MQFGGNKLFRKESSREVWPRKNRGLDDPPAKMKPSKEA